MAGECKHLALQGNQVICDGLLLRHVHLSNITKKGNPSPSSFAKYVDSLSDGCSVDLLCMTSARRARIVLGLQKRGRPEDPWKEYKNPANYLLFEMSVREARAIVEVADVIHSPSNMEDPLWRGRPRNDAHCLVRPSHEVKHLMLLAEITRPHAECPDVSEELAGARARFDEYCARHGTLGP